MVEEVKQAMRRPLHDDADVRPSGTPTESPHHEVELWAYMRTKVIEVERGKINRIRANSTSTLRVHVRDTISGGRRMRNSTYDTFINTIISSKFNVTITTDECSGIRDNPRG